MENVAPSESSLILLKGLQAIGTTSFSKQWLFNKKYISSLRKSLVLVFWIDKMYCLQKLYSLYRLFGSEN